MVYEKFIPTEDEKCAAHGLLLLASSCGGMCVWSSLSTRTTPATTFSFRATASATSRKPPRSTIDNFMHKCDVCGRTYKSHLALGGHKTTHRPRPTTTALLVCRPGLPRDQDKFHDCSVCHERFPSGQALGGHMRKHFDGVIGGGAHKRCKTSSGSGNSETTVAEDGDRASAIEGVIGGGAHKSCKTSTGSGNSETTASEDGDRASTRPDFDLNLPYTPPCDE